MAQTDVQPERACPSTDSEGYSEDTQCVLDRIERRLGRLERVLLALCQHRQSVHKKRTTTFDYIEFWLSTTVHPDNTYSPIMEQVIGVTPDD